MRKKKNNERMVNTIFAVLLFGSLLLFAGVPAINQAKTLGQATSAASK